MKEWFIDIPGDPVAQARPRFARVGKGVTAYDTLAVKDYKAYFKTMVAEKRPDELFDCPLYAAIVVTVRKPKSWSRKRVHADTKPDADNFAKLVCDCLEGLVYTNDSRIVSLWIRKELGEKPCVKVVVGEFEREAVE